MDRDWLYERCNEVQENPNGYLDLWSREHYKSTIITYAKNIQDILCNPDVTIGIFSHTRPIAKAFLLQIKREFEENEVLQDLFSDILYKNPSKDAPSWSGDGGIVVQRKTNPKEATVEAWGLVDGQPTSKHYSILCYDDVVTIASVTSPEMISKVTDAWRISLNLGAHGGVRRIIGTRYHFADTYEVMLKQGSAQPRIYPATDTGLSGGKPVFLDQKTLDEKYRDMGSYVFSCQMLQSPMPDGEQTFNRDDIRYYYNIVETLRSNWNYYVLVDSANSKKKGSDYTVITCVACGDDGNYYVADAVRDRMNLRERTEALFNMVQKYKPLDVFYEKYGQMSDIEHIEDEMDRRSYHFNITALGGKVSKEDRIRKLVPITETNRLWIPQQLHKVNLQGKMENLTEILIEELTQFPYSQHDDFIDCISRMVDPDAFVEFPDTEGIQNRKEKELIELQNRNNIYDPLSMGGIC